MAGNQAARAEQAPLPASALGRDGGLGPRQWPNLVRFLE